MSSIARRLFLGIAILALPFLPPLVYWVAYGWRHDEASYVLLIPIVVAYLVRIRIREDGRPTAENRLGCARLLFWVPAVLTLGVWWFVPLPGGDNWYVVLPTLALVLGVLALTVWQLGSSTFWKLRFPAFFLLLMVPVPTPLIDRFEVFLQHASAFATAGLFPIAGVSFVHQHGDPLFFDLGTIGLRVAQECSGVRSTLVLLVVSLLAGHLLLRCPWRKWVLVLIVLPLGILRNAFRIVTIGWLCVNVDASMIDSPIHHHGGPIFFALALIPFLFLVYWLKRGEDATRTRGPDLSSVGGPTCVQCPQAGTR